MACLMSSWCQFSYACICSLLQLCVAKGSPTAARFSFCLSLDTMVQLGQKHSVFSQGCLLMERGKCAKLSISFPVKNETWRQAREKSAVPLVLEVCLGDLRAEMEDSSVQILWARPEWILSASWEETKPVDWLETINRLRTVCDGEHLFNSAAFTLPFSILYCRQTGQSQEITWPLHVWTLDFCLFGCWRRIRMFLLCM